MLRALLRLTRIPNVFTAFSNVAAGVVLARAGHFRRQDLALVVASGALYCGGMVLNDYFDREVDARERPDRPIPSGEISAKAAAAFGSLLIAVGLLLAALHGWPSLLIAVLLAAMIMAYDAWLKASALGPVAMGLCRGLNVGLGLVVARWNTSWLLGLPLGLTLFTLLITQFSRFEVDGTDSARLRTTVFSLIGLALAIVLALGGVALSTHGGLFALLYALLPFTFALVRGFRLFAPLLHTATPPLLGRAIGGGILLMPALDAAFVGASGAPILAALLFCTAGPAYVLKRWYYLT